MDSDFSGGKSPRRKPKLTQPLDKLERPPARDPVPREGGSEFSDGAAGPEASEALALVPDHSDQSAAASSSPEVVHSVHGESTNLPEPASASAAGPDADHSSFDRKSPARTSSQRSKLAWLKQPLSKKQKIIALAGAVVLVLAAGASAYWYSQKTVQPLVMTKAVVKPKPKPEPVYSPLTGLPVTKAQAEMPVTGVMIENSLPARPQSGLASAGVVYEALTEAGISRFLALFQGEDPSNIGPIRSARPYFVSWVMGYDAGYAHVGGSPEALQDITDWGVHDLNQFYAGSYYHRISSRWAPHNVYTSLDDLHKLEDSRGYTSSSFTGFSRKADAPAKTPTAATINMNLSSPDFAVKYVYQPSSNTYERYEGGKPHIDANTNQPISPKVVVALVIPYSRGVLDSSGAYYSAYDNVGSGAAYIFQDGGVTKGQWQKASNSASLELVDVNGQPLKLDRGQTWLTALASEGELSYTP